MAHMTIKIEQNIILRFRSYQCLGKFVRNDR